MNIDMSQNIQQNVTYNDTETLHIFEQRRDSNRYRTFEE